MEESFAYSCPNCGGTVTYNSEKKKWICDYCSNEYEKLFNVDGNKLGDAQNGVQLFYYYCESCGNSFYSANESSTCTRCNSNITGQKESLPGIINDNLVLEKANYIVWKELVPYAKKYNLDIKKVELQSKYIKSDLINGSIIITNNKKSIEYFFSGVVYPYLDTTNYRILYDFANEGFNSASNTMDFNQTFFSISKEDKDKNLNDNYIRNKIIETCKDEFINKYGTDDVIVKDNLKIKKGMLMKVYYYSFNYDGKEYTTYFIISYSSRYNKVSIDVPQDSSVTKDQIRSAIFWCNIFKYLSYIAFAIGILLLIADSFFSVAFSININTLVIIKFTSLALGILFVIIFLNLSTKIKIYKNTINIDETLFYKNLLENSKLVKKVRS